MSPVPTIPTASLNLQTYSLKPTAYSLAPQVPGSAEFRHFGFSTFAPQKPPKMRLAPTHDRHNTCKRKKSAVSPYVTFDFVARRAPDPSRARQQAVPENPDPQSQSTPTAGPISTAASTFSWTLSNAPAHRRRSKFRRFDVSTFRRFRPKTTQIANHPNPRPPQALAQSPKPLCHLMSPCVLPVPRRRSCLQTAWRLDDVPLILPARTIPRAPQGEKNGHRQDHRTVAKTIH